MDSSQQVSSSGLDYKKIIQGQYEAERLPGDFSPERIVPDFAFNVLNTRGLLYIPVLDWHRLKEGHQKPIWPGGRSFAVCLTHDVDAVISDSFQERNRARRRHSSTTSLFTRLKYIGGTGLDVFRSLRHGGEKDALYSLERWLDIEKQIGAHSTFFFWPGCSSVSKYHQSDCKYELTDPIVFDGQKCTVTEMLREIDRRGWEIGLHPSWFSYNDLEEMKRQKGALEKALGSEIVSVRQHYLHYDIRVTPRIHTEAGFKYDSSLGFNDNIGFRFGTSYPWYLYDLESHDELSILEIPLIIQDGALLHPNKGMRLDEETAFQYVVQIAEEVEKVGGVLTLLWHPGHTDKSEWWGLYIKTLLYLRQKQTWFACVREIGDWWRAAEQVPFVSEAHE